MKFAANRPGLTARYRDGYEATPDGAPLESSSIRLQVKVERGAKVRLDVVNDARDVGAGPIDAAFAQRSVDGRDLGTTFSTLRGSAGAARGIGFVKEIAPAADAVEVKIVIIDRGSGRIGSIAVPLK